MLNNLRERLLISYTLIIAVTLCVVGAALLLLLLNTPLPTRQTYQRLADIARASIPLMQLNESNPDPALKQIAEVNDIRVIRIVDGSTIAFDSGNQLAAGRAINLRMIQDRDASTQRGIFRDEQGQLWLYVAGIWPSSESSRDRVIFAAPRPRAPVLSFFGEYLMRPLIQAGTLALCAAVVLAALISNSVARPLKRAAWAARAVAAGNYQTRAPEAGPQEVRDLARAFNSMVVEVQTAQQIQRDFLANVSHELKTPLTSIQGYSQAILDGAAPQPSVAAQVIYDEAGRMHRLVEDLLVLARIESGQAMLQRGPIQIGELIDTLVDRHALRAHDKGITLCAKCEKLPDIMGDHDRLLQVFSNLIDNAITYTPPGGQVAVRGIARDRGVIVQVSDTGKGIPASDLSRIFERFYQVDKARARGSLQGAGLGLTISKEIVEAHGGSIRVESEEGHGTTFTVWLPRGLPEEADFREPSSD